MDIRRYAINHEMAQRERDKLYIEYPCEAYGTNVKILAPYDRLRSSMEPNLDKYLIIATIHSSDQKGFSMLYKWIVAPHPTV